MIAAPADASAVPARGLTLLTPTFGRDLERFALLRESMDRGGVDLPHVAVVHTEDVAAFRAIKHNHRLTVRTTAEVLPPELERRRVARGYPRRDPRHWIRPRPLHGWMSQQYVKILGPSVCETDSVVVLDSDELFVRPVTEDAFFAEDGRLHLYESEGPMTPELAEWFIHAARFFELRMTAVHAAHYTWSPVPVHAAVAAGLMAALEERSGLAWYEAMDRFQLMEYTALGVYARHLDGCRHQVPVAPRGAKLFCLPEHVEGLAVKLKAVREDPEVFLVRVQSNTGVEPAAIREALWKES